MKKNNIFQFIKIKLKKLRIINKESNQVIKKMAADDGLDNKIEDIIKVALKLF